jgi:DNA (cytosine-5)-methyltransferase 1
MKLKLLDLFSGIGGFSLGLESTGYFKTIAFVEKDKFCQQVLQKNFKDTPIESEVRNVKGERYAADIITGGFPCQPFSVAGKRRGTDDDRYLWDETIRIIRECKPRWFIGENVEGIINIQGGVVLRQVQDDLEKEGFQVQCLVIPASGIGAWHQRKRVWILAYSKHNGSHRSKGNETIESSNQSKEWLFIGDDKDVSNSNSRLGIGENEEVQARGNTINDGSEDVPNTNSGMRGRWGTEQSSGANQEWRFCTEKEKQTQHDIRSKAVGCDAIHGEDVLNSNSIGLQRRSIQSNNLQETSNSTETTNTSSKEQYTWWQAQSSLCGVPNGISYELDKSRSNRIKSLGNSIVPLIARELGIAIMKAEQDG